jgi:SPP1 gp7 family putative phage head morphogenesis protein
MVARKKKSKGRTTKRRSNKKYLKFERALIRFNREMVSDLQKAIVKSIIPRIDLLAATAKSEKKEKKIIMLDAAGDGITLNQLIDSIESQFVGFYSKDRIRGFLQPFFRDIGREADLDANKEFAKQNFAIAPSAGQEAIIGNAIDQTLNRMRSLQASALGDIRSEVSKGVQNGDRWETIAKRLQKSAIASSGSDTPTPFKKAMNQARFIARNTVSESLGELQKDQQTNAGIDLYQWQTSEDERVRPTHNSLNGGIFSWSGTVVVDGVTYEEAIDPSFSSSGTIPGQPWNCRCTSIPFIPELEE